jgi:SAM-dependent methyltransferase
MTDFDLISILRESESSWKANDREAALAGAFAAYCAAPEDRRARGLFARQLRDAPALVRPEMKEALLGLLRDPDVEPTRLSRAGWALQRLADAGFIGSASEGELAVLARRLDRDEFALSLLRECPVADREVEMTLSRLRRWLTLSGSWASLPALAGALAAQAALNGGAWPFEEDERILVSNPGHFMTRAYLPEAPAGAGHGGSDLPDRVTRAVAGQYEAWPYPVWSRITLPPRCRLRDAIRNVDEEAAAGLPVEARILVAGCGTGRQAASVAARFPESNVTAIDISEASLDYARRQCARQDIPKIEFRRLDLIRVEELRESFDAIYCTGVLHHLPDPEAGWRALEAVLKPGGVMRVGVYSRTARMKVRAARLLLGGLSEEPVNDGLLRRARGRLLMQMDNPAIRSVVESADFSTLAGTHDLLFNTHEDPFDVPRIASSVKQLGLRMLGFDPPTPSAALQYAKLFPGDPGRRDFESWKQFEFQAPGLFAGMYRFWCAKK